MGRDDDVLFSASHSEDIEHGRQQLTSSTIGDLYPSTTTSQQALRKSKPVLSAPSVGDSLKILSFNVGHGDCTLLEYWEGAAIVFRCLVDAGQRLPDALLTHLRAHRRAAGANDIDVLVLSHVDADHQGGLPGLLKNDVRVGEYFGPCLPTFRRLNYLFEKRVQDAIDHAEAFESELRKLNVPVTYPLEGFSARFAQGRVVMSVISPAARLLERLSVAGSQELGSLLSQRPLPLGWLNAPANEDLEDDFDQLRSMFRGTSNLSPDDFDGIRLANSSLRAKDIQDMALANGIVEEPDFFGNSVLNDTSLIVAIDVYLEGIHRKRVLLTGDQENWTYVTAQHPAGLGVNVLKAPHHGGRVYLGDKREEMDALYLWMRPQSVLVSANGHHDLPRATFRNAIRSIGASLICPNVRTLEPLSAGTVAHAGKASCHESFACKSPDSRVTTVKLTAHDESADAYACVQGAGYAGVQPIVVLRQEIQSPSEVVVRYTRGELEKHASWLRKQLGQRHTDFKANCLKEPGEFSRRVEQPAVSWKDLSVLARADGRHNLAADPGPVIKFARSHRHFWVSSGTTSHPEQLSAYRQSTKDELAKAQAWLLRVPRMFLYADVIDVRQLVAKDPINLLGCVDWKVVDCLLAGKLGVPEEMVSDEIRPSMLPALAQGFRGRICNAVYKDHPFESGRGMLMLERAVGAIPDVVEKRVNDVLDTTRFLGRAPWDELLELASTQVLLGTFFCSTRQYGSSNRYLDLLNNDLDEYLPEHRKRTLQQKLDQARWRELW